MTGVPTREEILEMERLRRILNGESVDDIKPLPVAPGQATDILDESAQRKQNIQAMSSILEKLNHATGNAVQSLTESAAYDPEIREALVTRRTERGAQIGEWEIQSNRIDKANRTIEEWSIVNTTTGVEIANGINLYEVAHSLVRLLNKGHGINNAKVLEVLKLDEEYRRNRQDALQFKRHYKLNESKDPRKADVYEARYQRAREQALQARNKIIKINEDII